MLGASRMNKKHSVWWLRVRQGDGSPSWLGVTTCTGPSLSQEDACARLLYHAPVEGSLVWGYKLVSQDFSGDHTEHVDGMHTYTLTNL